MANVSPQILSTQSLTPSLFDLFQAFLQDNLAQHKSNLGPQQMRLLLHPLQSLLCHLRQMLSCFTDSFGTGRVTAGTMSKASTSQRMEEVQVLLEKWYKLAKTMLETNPNCSVTKCNMVLYHLISLNAITSFPEIERLARKEGMEAGGPTYWELGLRHKRCIYQREKAIFHCLEVFNLLRSLPADRQPSWWSTALYRATLILWTDGLGRLDPSFKATTSSQLSKEGCSPGSSFVGSRSDVFIKKGTPDAAMEYLRGDGDATPLLPTADNPLVTLDNPAAVLDVGIKTIGAGVSTRIGDGIRRKLDTLSANWKLDSIGVSPVGVSYSNR